jgi:hypothetical protein
MCGDKFERRQIKMGSGVPTIPASTDHRNGDWIATDIYDGEFYMDTDTGLTYTRNGASIQTAGKGSENFANADLTLTGLRTHDLNNYGVIFENGEVDINATGTSFNGMAITTDNATLTYSALVLENSGGGNAFVVNSGYVKIIGLPTYANEAAAVIGGLATSTLYKTATGELRIKL